MAKQKQRDFLFDGGEKVKPLDSSETADQFMDALVKAGGAECADAEKCATCLHPCGVSKSAPLPAVAEHEQGVAALLIAINDAMGKARRPDGEKPRNTEAMSAGAVLVGVLAGDHLAKDYDGVERMMLKLQTVAAYQQLSMALKVLHKQGIGGIPVVIALAKHLDTSVRLCSKSIHADLIEHEGKKQA